MAIWHNTEILDEIARRIKSPEDFVAFSRVCKSSREASEKENMTFTYQPIPWLMLPPKPIMKSLSPTPSTIAISLPKAGSSSSTKPAIYSSSTLFPTAESTSHIAPLSKATKTTVAKTPISCKLSLFSNSLYPSPPLPPNLAFHRPGFYILSGRFLRYR